MAVSTFFETELLALCESQNLVISDYQLLGRLSEQFTYVSDAHSTTSWLDHFICSHDLHQRITSLHILDKSPCSDHLPIHAVFNLDVIGTIDSCEGSESNNCSTVPAINYQWSKATDVDIDNYFRGTHMILKSIVIPIVIYCTDVDCKHAGHIRDIDTYYDNICDTLVVVSRMNIPSSTFKCSADYIVPGFNEHLKDLHEKATVESFRGI